MCGRNEYGNIIIITDSDDIIVENKISDYFIYNIVNEFCNPMSYQAGEDISSDIIKFVKEHAEYSK